MTAAAAPDSGMNQTVDFMADRFLAVVAKLAEAEAAVQRVRDLCDDAERGEGIVITPGFTTYYSVDCGLLRLALAGAE